MTYFNSWDIKCKSPFGAVSKDSKVKFTVFSDTASQCYVILNDREIKMQKGENKFFAEIEINSIELIFYCFKLVSEKGIVYYIGKSSEENSYFSLDIPMNRFQITVTECNEKIPKWYNEGIVYQIFPDRFRKEGEILNPKANSFVYNDWYQAPEYIKNGNDIAKWDFFGGNLKGIISKLDYLKELNVTAIYLNPVFEACSNHRYNTGNYYNIDPTLGTSEDFESLIKEAEKRNMKIILDGVFNHVGADSIYFNKFGNYNSFGACQGENSPYRNWFKFTSYPNEYKGWWGVDDLPVLDTENPEVQDFIIENKESVINYWTKKGIGGWRLDVADELSDNFLFKLNKKVKEYKNTVVLGEVWEDASNKMAYDIRKSYFARQELDGVMNYPLRDNLILFYSDKINAKELKNIFMTQMENYPNRNFLANLNLIGTHDVERILTVVREINREKAFEILKQIITLQFLFPGVPCIYYGDEAGLEGGKDPDNRKCYPWGRENTELLKFYKKITKLRSENELLKKGNTVFESIDDDVFSVVRYNADQKLILYVNRSKDSKAFICPFTNKTIELKGFDYSLII